MGIGLVVAARFVRRLLLSHRLAYSLELKLDTREHFDVCLSAFSCDLMLVKPRSQIDERQGIPGLAQRVQVGPGCRPQAGSFPDPWSALLR